MQVPKKLVRFQYCRTDWAHSELPSTRVDTIPVGRPGNHGLQHADTYILFTFAYSDF